MEDMLIKVKTVSKIIYFQTLPFNFSLIDLLLPVLFFNMILSLLWHCNFVLSYL